MILFGIGAAMAVFGYALALRLAGGQRVQCLTIATAWAFAMAMEALRLWG